MRIAQENHSAPVDGLVCTSTDCCLRADKVSDVGAFIHSLNGRKEILRMNFSLDSLLSQKSNQQLTGGSSCAHGMHRRRKKAREWAIEIENLIKLFFVSSSFVQNVKTRYTNFYCVCMGCRLRIINLENEHWTYSAAFSMSPCACVCACAFHKVDARVVSEVAYEHNEGDEAAAGQAPKTHAEKKTWKLISKAGFNWVFSFFSRRIMERNRMESWFGGALDIMKTCVMQCCSYLTQRNAQTNPHTLSSRRRLWDGMVPPTHASLARLK